MQKRVYLFWKKPDLDSSRASENVVLHTAFNNSGNDPANFAVCAHDVSVSFTTCHSENAVRPDRGVEGVALSSAGNSSVSVRCFVFVCFYCHI